MTTIRLDTLENRLHAAIDLWTLLLAELVDLHSLAYDRPRAVSERVRASSPDYALDTHGDRRARDAYRNLSEALVKAGEDVCVAVHDANALLGEGGQRGNSRRMVGALELAERLTAQETRVGAGDYVSARRNPQPDRDTALAVATKELKRLQRERDKLLRAVPAQHRDRCEFVEDRSLVREVRRMGWRLEEKQAKQKGRRAG